MKIAINGAGIAGTTLAYWLQYYGNEVILYEKAPQFRTGGYIIDFWGLGYTVAERMGILPAIQSAGYEVQALEFVDSMGKLQAQAPVNTFHRLTNHRFTSISRGDLAAEIYKSISHSKQVKTHFGCSIQHINDQGDCVTLTLSDGSTQDCDLVLGADGLHSQVRQHILGAQTQYEQDLGLRVAAFEIKNDMSHTPCVLVGHSQPGRQIMRFTSQEGKTLFLFVYQAHLSKTDPDTPAERKTVIRNVFHNMGWEAPAILEAMDTLPDIYHDRVSQIRLPHWSQGRVALVGDAAACASLLAGQGSSLAMGEAYVLAGELMRSHGDHTLAFQRYEQRMHRFLLNKQKAATRMSSSFAPASQWDIFLRNLGLKLLQFPWLADWLLGPSLKDDFVLPDYAKTFDREP